MTRHLRLMQRMGVLCILVILISHRQLTGVVTTIQLDHRRTEEQSPARTDVINEAPRTNAHQTGVDFTVAADSYSLARSTAPDSVTMSWAVDNKDTQPPTRARQDDTNARRRRQMKRGKVHPVELKVPKPVFVPSLPKSGTTSIHKYFLCGGQNSAHHVYKNNGKLTGKIGRCWKQNIKKGKPPLRGCGDHDIWSDTGFVGLRYRQGINISSIHKEIPCYYPLIEALDQVYTFYPNSTFLFITRNETDWLKSVETYHEGFIVDVWKQCNIPGFPGSNSTPEDFKSFYQWHQDLIRDFAKKHPSITYIEVPLEAENTGQLLEESIGINQLCWGHHNKQATTSTRAQ